MRTVVLGERTPELEALIARRRALGHDRHDEVWDGEYHMAPAAHGRHAEMETQFAVVLHGLARPLGLWVAGPVNIGGEDNFRVPDLTVHRARPDRVWFPTAAMVLEIVSPDDESWLKFDHYAAHDVGQVLIDDPQTRTLALFVLAGGSYEPAEVSGLLGVTVAALHDAIDWPGSG